MSSVETSSTGTSGSVSERIVESADGVRIAVYEQGNPDGPTVVMVHGWPDSHVVWDGVVPLLEDRYRIIRYDNRGVGKSSVPKPFSSHTMACYADDFDAVARDVSPAGPVHVLAHDWGSVGIWEYLSRPTATERIASFTSISGPSADHLNRFVIGRLKRPYRPRQFAQGVSQLLRLTYMGANSIPILAPLVVRIAFRAGLITRILRRDSVPPNQIHHSADLISDAVNSLKVYRANYFASFARRRKDHHVDVPVQVIVGTGDPFVRPYLYDETRSWVSRLWRRDVKAGHWSLMSHPQVVAQSVTELIDFLGGGILANALLSAQIGSQRVT